MLRFIVFNVRKNPLLKKIGYYILNKFPNFKIYVQGRLINSVGLVHSQPVHYSHLSPQAQEIFSALKTELNLKSNKL